MTPSDLRAQPLGDSAVTISFGDRRSAALLRRIHAAARSLRESQIHGFEDVVPAYLALTVFYDPIAIRYSEIADAVLRECARAPDDAPAETAREHLIPVRYDGEDLEAVAASTGLSIQQVVRLHSGGRYTADLIGFVPGFAYLSELDLALHLPRRAQPRPRVAAGSVAIAGAQTAVYPLDTPGGWHLIGSTETVMFDAERDPPALISPGDIVRFSVVE